MSSVPAPTPTQPSLRIQIVSDLHIEFYNRLKWVPKDIIRPCAPVLALLGDIGLACTDLLRGFLHQQADRFETVLFLAGNHEFYNERGSHKTIDEQIQWMREICAERDNLIFLEKDSIELCGVRILATTLWSYIPSSLQKLANNSMNDYALSYVRENGQLRKLTAKDTCEWHQESVRFLKQELKRSRDIGEPVLVLTHHTPWLRGTSAPQYEGGDLNCCFSTDLSRFLKHPVQVWACGHTHWNFDMVVGDDNVRLVSNQRGYDKREWATYDSEGVVLEISK